MGRAGLGDDRFWGLPAHWELFAEESIEPRPRDRVPRPHDRWRGTVADARRGRDPDRVMTVLGAVGGAQDLARDPRRVDVAQVQIIPVRERRERLEFRRELLEGKPGRGKVLLVVAPDLRPLRVREGPVRVVRQFLEVRHAEVGGDGLERRVSAAAPRTGREVDVVSLDCGPTLRGDSHRLRHARPVVTDDGVRDRVRVLPGEDGPNHAGHRIARCRSRRASRRPQGPGPRPRRAVPCRRRRIREPRRRAGSRSTSGAPGTPRYRRVHTCRFRRYILI